MSGTGCNLFSVVSRAPGTSWWLAGEERGRDLGGAEVEPRLRQPQSHRQIRHHGPIAALVAVEDHEDG